MAEPSKKFLDILVKPAYKQYAEVWMLIRHQPYLIKIPVTPDKSNSELRKLANAKILYRLEHPSPVKQGRPLKYHYENKREANRLYQEAFQAKKLRLAVKPCA